LLLDTSVLIAYLDGDDETTPVAVAIIDGFIRSERNRAIVSMVTVMEVLVGPARTGDRDLYAAVIEFLTQLPGLRLQEVDLGIAERAASLRARYKLRAPDALIVATAATTGVGRIVSNDRSWSAVSSVTGLTAPVVLVGDHLPFGT
jgi:predicted nucleic acid-binding protein